MNKDVKTYEIRAGEFLDTIWAEIPSNSIVDKGRCGIGGTTMELKSNRHSIILVPNISIIESKQLDFSNIIPVYGAIGEGIIIKKILAELRNGSWLKIMTTPDSFEKLMRWFEYTKVDVMKECFLLVDECHSIITEGVYRSNMTAPLKYA